MFICSSLDKLIVMCLRRVLHINLQHLIVVAQMMRFPVSLGYMIILPLVNDVIIVLKGKRQNGV
jgi:hypothetical protein